jgi:hypothetical protein
MAESTWLQRCRWYTLATGGVMAYVRQSETILSAPEEPSEELIIVARLCESTLGLTTAEVTTVRARVIVVKAALLIALCRC